MTPRISSPAVMPIARKSKSTSQPYSPAEIAAAKAAAKAPLSKVAAVDWSKGTVTRGGGVAATIDAIRRTRGPNKNPTKEQVAIRFDRGGGACRLSRWRAGLANANERSAQGVACGSPTQAQVQSCA